MVQEAIFLSTMKGRLLMKRKFTTISFRGKLQESVILSKYFHLYKIVVKLYEIQVSRPVYVISQNSYSKVDLINVSFSIRGFPCVLITFCSLINTIT